MSALYLLKYANELIFVDNTTGCFSIPGSERQWLRLCDLKEYLDLRTAVGY